MDIETLQSIMQEAFDEVMSELRVAIDSDKQQHIGN